MSDESSRKPTSPSGEKTPVGSFSNLPKYLRYDLLSGFLVFLIALPLCLSIALAYGYPPIAGVFTAIIGGLVSTFISNSELTIKGPAAGLIAIAAPCMMYFGWSGVPGEFNMEAYRAALAVGVAAGVIQILFGLFRVGSLGDFFPSAAVHGMLAAIGVIIVAKEIPPTLGVSVKGDPLHLLAGIPQIVTHLQPQIAVVGGVSLAIMFLWPLWKVKFLKAVPAAIVVMAVAIPLSAALKLGAEHTNRISLNPHTNTAEAEPHPAPSTTPTQPSDGVAHVAPQEPSDTLVVVPAFGKTFNAMTFPKFDALLQLGAWKWVIMFAIIGTLESMLSAKAMDLLDPWQRKTSLNRDNVAVGIGNTLCALVGAAPMISEIVRSRANMDNGARTRFADMYHALFLLAFVVLLPFVIGMIPIAALTAMLIYTGYRLAHPREFVHVFKIGPEQLAIYCVTLVAVLWTDLLQGIAIGIGLKFLIHLFNGVPIRSLFRPYLEVIEVDDDTYRIVASHSAVFSNWILFRRQIVDAGLVHHKNVIVDLSDTRLVDHTVMGKLQELARDFENEGLRLEVVGLDNHRPLSSHPLAARKRSGHAVVAH